LGSALASDLSKFIHFISGVPLALNREVLQSPYFSFYSNRRTFEFSASAEFYENSFLPAARFFVGNPISFDHGSRPLFLEKIQKELLSQNISPEWLLKFKVALNSVVEQVFPARLDCTLLFSGSVLKLTLRSASVLDREKFQPVGLLDLGVSATISNHDLVLFIPPFQKLSQAMDVFRFLKAER